jgi:hypothetical protein
MPLGMPQVHWQQRAFTGCGKTRVSYQGIALAMP